MQQGYVSTAIGANSVASGDYSIALGSHASTNSKKRELV